ncbi:hypothetical protein [Trinickia sp.]|uniref:hypothetical protein n=1 Tax=Trinickia sp. TaxID=2571163 RepID=UPI003F7FB789
MARSVFASLGAAVVAPAKALTHAHAHKHPTNTFFKPMRVSALITKKVPLLLAVRGVSARPAQYL